MRLRGQYSGRSVAHSVFVKGWCGAERQRRRHQGTKGAPNIHLVGGLLPSFFLSPPPSPSPFLSSTCECRPPPLVLTHLNPALQRRPLVSRRQAHSAILRFIWASSWARPASRTLCAGVSAVDLQAEMGKKRGGAQAADAARNTCAHVQAGTRSSSPHRSLSSSHPLPLNPHLCMKQILGSGADVGGVPAVMLFFDHSRFLFNIPEGFQRFASQHKIKLTKARPWHLPSQLPKKYPSPYQLDFPLVPQGSSLPRTLLHQSPSSPHASSSSLTPHLSPS